MLSNGTIIALSTPQGQGAIGLIRISGPKQYQKLNYFFKQSQKLQLMKLQLKK